MEMHISESWEDIILPGSGGFQDQSLTLIPAVFDSEHLKAL